MTALRLVAAVAVSVAAGSVLALAVLLRLLAGLPDFDDEGGQ